MKKIFLLPFLILLLSVRVDSRAQTTVDKVVYDMMGEPYRTSGPFGVPWGKHEGGLRGVPSNYDWADGARPGEWLNYGSSQAITSWGEAYEWANGSPEKNIRIQVRNLKTYAYANGSWTLIEEANFGGSNFKEDYTSSAGLSNVRNESSGGISFTMVDGYNYHWWVSSWPRPTLPGGTQAIYSSCEIRLIPNTNPNVNLNNAKYLAGVSCDYYPTTTSSGPGPWPSLAVTRHKFIKPTWDTFTMYIAGNPVPGSVTDYRNNILSRPLPPGVSNAAAAVSDGWYRLTPKHNSSLAVDMVNCGDFEGTDVKVWSWLNNNCQRFYLQNLGNGYYRITPKTNSNLALDVSGCGGSGTNVLAWTWLDNDCQKWQIQGVGDSYYRLTPKNNSSPALDVKDCGGASNGAGADIQVHTWLNNDCQKFKLEPVSSSAREGVASERAGQVMESNQLQAYPNPARTEITLESTEALRDVKVVDAQGRTSLHKDQLKTNRVTLPIGRLREGMYIIQTRTLQGHTQSRKLLIQR